MQTVARLARLAFSTSTCRMSFIGKAPVRLAEGVLCFTEKIPLEFSKTFNKGKTLHVLNQNLVVKGPKGVLKTLVPDFVHIKTEDDTVEVSVEDPTDKVQRSMWGTARLLLQNNVDGTSNGHLAIVKFVGTGFRALLEEENGQQVVVLKVGFPYTPRVKVPKGITVSSPNPTRLLIEGIDKQQVKLLAARIREIKKPEPYKGKGLYVDSETIRMKAKTVK